MRRVPIAIDIAALRRKTRRNVGIPRVARGWLAALSEGHSFVARTFEAPELPPPEAPIAVYPHTPPHPEAGMSIWTVHDVVRRELAGAHCSLDMVAKGLRTLSQQTTVHATSPEVARQLGNIGLSRAQTWMCPLGVDFPPVVCPSSEPKRSFLLILGTVQPRKNIELVIRSARLVGLPLVVVGHPGEDGEYVKRVVKAARDAGSTVVVGPVSEAQRDWLVSNAACVVQSSVAEGFGMVPIEAASVATPVALSDISVHRWTLGTAAAYFDPTSRHSCATAINQAIARGIPCSTAFNLRRRFSWSRFSKHLHLQLSAMLDSGS